MVEKRVADRWTNAAEDSSTGSKSEEQAQNRMSALKSSDKVQSQPDQDHGKFAILKLLKQPRILIAMWGILVQALVIASFDAVRGLFLMIYFPC